MSPIPQIKTNFLFNIARLTLAFTLIAGLFSHAYAAAGDLDITFGVNGFTFTDIGMGTGDKAFAVAIQSTGEIVVAGSSNTDIAVARYTSAGALDTTFSSDGKTTTSIGGVGDVANDVVIQSDGKIVVAGSTNDGLNDHFALVRYEATGSLDTSFGTGGIVTNTLTMGSDVAQALALQADDKIVVAGHTNDDFAVVRYQSSGALDTTFDSDGIVTTDFFAATDRAYDIAIDGDGKLVVAGFSDSGSSDEFAVARYNNDGSLDTTFSSNGLVVTDFDTNSIDQAFAVDIQSDGKIVLAGFVNVGGGGATDDFALARYNSNGILDTTFNTDGKVTTAVGSNDDQAYAMSVSATGKIVVAGFSDNGAITHQDFSLVRYTIIGTLDTDFGGGDGIVSTDLGTINTVNTSADEVYAAALQEDGMIVMAGFTDHPAGNDNFAVVRYEAPNIAPTVTSFAKSHNEDHNINFTNSDFANNFDDADSDAIAKVQINSLPTNGTLLLNTNPVTLSQEILSADLGGLVFAPDTDWNGATSFNWNGSDGQDYAATGAAVNITISPVNDAPSFTSGGDHDSLEDAGIQTVDGWATDISPGPPDEAAQNLNFLISTNNNALFTTIPNINSSTGDLSYRAAPDANGSAQVTVVLMDDGGTANGGSNLSPSQMFTITVEAVNDAPSFTSGQDQVVDEDAGPQTVSSWAKNISPGPADEAGQQLTFILETNNDGLFADLPAIDPLSGDLTYTTGDDLYGTAAITVTLQDDGGTLNGGQDTSVPRNFTITINAVNDAPLVADVAKTGFKSANVLFTQADFDDSFNDVDGDSLAKILVTFLPANGTLYLSGIPVTAGQEIIYADLGDLVFTPSAGWFGLTGFPWNGSDGFVYADVGASVNIDIKSVAPNTIYLPVVVDSQ